MDKVLVTGGAGFVGSNLVEHWLAKGSRVIAFDNLSRPGGGAEKNIDYLLGKYKNKSNFKFMQADVRDLDQLKKAMPDVDVVFHLAAQTAMTTSIEDPAEDFETNARGTFNVLEAARSSGADPVIIYTSTNKVYGDLTRRPMRLVEKEKRWDFADKEYFEGIDESYPLDFEGPYGCSKGVGDAYCLDYARTFGLRTVVFRMSGIYGMGQHSTEDQGWVAWFVRQAIAKKPLVIYGDGKQVRDILFITDLLDAFDRAVENIEAVRGQVYNIGGQRKNSVSVLELLGLMEGELGIRPSEISFDSWRLADQKVYISNTARARKDLGWEARIDKEEGIRRLHEWMKESGDL